MVAQGRDEHARPRTAVAHHQERRPRLPPRCRPGRRRTCALRAGGGRRRRHLTFRLVRSTPTGQGDNQPGVATRRYVFACLDTDDDVEVDTITVDVVVGPAPVGQVEVVEPANRLHLSRPLVTHPYRLYPVIDQIADKVCATVDTNYPGGKRSSRMKDLVDLEVLAHSQSVELTEPRAAIEAKRLLSGLAPFEHIDIPEDWHRTYPGTAKGVPTAEIYTAATAAALVAGFIDPALEKSSNTAFWNAEELAWRPTPSVPRAIGFDVCAGQTGKVGRS